MIKKIKQELAIQSTKFQFIWPVANRVSIYLQRVFKCSRKKKQELKQMSRKCKVTTIFSRNYVHEIFVVLLLVLAKHCDKTTQNTIFENRCWSKELE